MLVKCPKCGFDQPDDTYCAKCGIEMGSYKPAKAPLWKTIVKSPLFSLGIFIGFGYATFMYLKHPEQLSSWLDRLPSSKTSSTMDASVPPLNPSPPPSAPETAAQTNSLAPEDGLSASLDEASKNEQITNSQPAPPPPAGALPRPSESFQTNERLIPRENPLIDGSVENSPINIEAIKGPLELEVRFVEAPVQLVQQFLAEASDNSGGDSGEMNFAIVKSSSRWLRQKSLIELDRFTKKVPGIKKKLQWFSGAQHPETGSTFGLNFQVSILERTGGHLLGQLVITRTLVENTNGVPMTTRKDFTTQFETDVGSLIGLVGVMPHINVPTDEKDWLQNSLLKVYLSPQFNENETELMVLLQFKGDSK